LKPVVVVGSLNLDLVVRPAQAPGGGETVFAPRLERFPGGKGGNQAVAAARLGAPVHMISRVGTDSFGDDVLRSLQDYGVSLAGISRSTEAGTGTASITVDGTGQNRIVVVAGANAEVTPAYVEQHADLIRSAAVLLLQLEVPVESCLRAAEIAAEAGIPVILDPAPAPASPLPDRLCAVTWLVSPNETEASTMTGVTVKGRDGAPQAARVLLNRGFSRVLIKLGGEGAYFAGPEGETWLASLRVPVVDTTAAGDAFAGGLAAALAQGHDLPEALRWASAAGALAVTRPGAQSAMGTRAELLALLQTGGARA
jgi:ribokinase